MSRVEQVLEKLGLEFRAQGRRAWLARCPLPSHGAHNPAHEYQNFFVRTDRGAFAGYHCFSCKGGGVLVDLVMLARGVSPERVEEIQREAVRAGEEGSRTVAASYPEYREALAWVRTVAGQETAAPFLSVRTAVVMTRRGIRLPPGVEMQGEPYERWVSVPREYAVSRGIPEWQAKRWRIGYALEGRLEGRLFLPIYDGKGSLVNYAARDFVGSEKRYLAAATWEGPDKGALFGAEHWPSVEFRKTVVVVEGALNGMAIERAMPSCLLGGMSGLDDSGGGEVDVRTLTALSTFRRVVIATDPDGAGNRAAEAIEYALRSRCDVVRLDLPRGKDACDLERENVEELARRVRSACAA